MGDHLEIFETTVAHAHKIFSDNQRLFFVFYKMFSRSYFSNFN